jgi:hypothetical protein
MFFVSSPTALRNHDGVDISRQLLPWRQLLFFTPVSYSLSRSVDRRWRHAPLMSYEYHIALPPITQWEVLHPE